MRKKDLEATKHFFWVAGGRPTFKTLQCVFCKEEKPLEEFSEMQVAKATFDLHAPALTNVDVKLISCLKCTAPPRETLTCCKCSKTKPLDQFARVQRRNAERPRCLKCMKKHRDEDVNDSDPDYSSDGSSLSETWDDYS
ncbi:Stc1 domain-containing protein [Zychaea mexicana]|uniref:Stc1 domain-containing protein n=1 Tax=Zychaea mexicana TaxID=64656 RepID=UPI0022FED597|nr:Stc1 domain-containing protein [Zychaea mexicana]KAI9497947.1 Stc1 domain-containing protein [Zychaea mexicana]